MALLPAFWTIKQCLKPISLKTRLKRLRVDPDQLIEHLAGPNHLSQPLKAGSCSTQRIRQIRDKAQCCFKIRQGIVRRLQRQRRRLSAYRRGNRPHNRSRRGAYRRRRRQTLGDRNRAVSTLPFRWLILQKAARKVIERGQRFGMGAVQRCHPQIAIGRLVEPAKAMLSSAILKEHAGNIRSDLKRARPSLQGFIEAPLAHHHAAQPDPGSQHIGALRQYSAVDPLGCSQSAPAHKHPGKPEPRAGRVEKPARPRLSVLLLSQAV
jgi:hypothetical protein